METCQRDLIDLERKAPECAKRFRFYQELRGYVTDLVECLDEKVGLLSSKRALWGHHVRVIIYNNTFNIIFIKKIFKCV